jgi:hypothetical protein
VFIPLSQHRSLARASQSQLEIGLRLCCDDIAALAHRNRSARASQSQLEIKLNAQNLTLLESEAQRLQAESVGHQAIRPLNDYETVKEFQA